MTQDWQLQKPEIGCLNMVVEAAKAVVERCEISGGFHSMQRLQYALEELESMRIKIAKEQSDG